MLRPQVGQLGALVFDDGVGGAEFGSGSAQFGGMRSIGVGQPLRLGARQPLQFVVVLLQLVHGLEQTLAVVDVL